MLKHKIESLKVTLTNPKLRRYLLVGIWNTVFSYILFSSCYYLLSDYIHDHVILTLTYIIAITNAFLLYKYFIFKTKGNFFKEYLKCYLVYGMGFILNFISFPLFRNYLLPFVFKIFGLTSYNWAIPYATQGVIIPLIFFVSYFGHDKISFSRSRASSDSI